MESIQRGFQDLGLLESWVSNAESCNPQVEDLLKDVYIENPDLKRTSALKEIEGPNQSVGDYLKYRCKDYATNSSSNYGNTQKRVKEFSCLGKPVWKSERGKGKFQNNDVANQSNSCVRSLDDWCKEKYSTSYDCIKAPVNGKQSANGYNYPFPKERGFQNTGRWKPFNEPIENHYNGFSSSVPFDGYENFAHQTFAKTLDYESLGNAVNLKDNIQASSIAQRWLDNESQKISSPLPSPSSSTFSDESPTHNSVCPNNYFGHVSPTAHSSKDGLSQVNGTSGKMPFSNFGGDDQRSGIQFANSPKKEAMPRKMPPCFPPAWTHQKQSFVHNTNSEKYHKTPKRHSPQNNPERRGKKNWSTPGNTRPNSQQYNSFQRKPEPNIGNVSDFINASFLPYSLMSDFKQNQNFPSLNQPGFPSPGTMSFPPPPFPFSDLIDLFQYEDLNHMNPFLSDLFCGDLSPPYFPYPTPFNRYRPPRNRSGPANELHMQLEEGCEQWRALEKERKKTEADLARNFPGTRVTSSYSSSIPRLPTNPSRVDRLIVDQLREHSRAVSLVKIMEKIRLAPLHVNISLALELHLEAIHLTQARRKDEIVNAANRQKQGAPRYNNEKDVLALAAAIKEMVLSTRKARTALWNDNILGLT
ncbi:hypothetical protein GDO86_012053 [Hymenochirus boettgeri]|uniref:Uncharacterized protein n=1 Tax=Hymenochirus boettgeri TaxID=247094 RepID=A0A8T2JLX1_9PIPI|nr:hypothetical protein GDO86_012053 [Hymenochirus boettgeri]